MTSINKLERDRLLNCLAFEISIASRVEGSEILTHYATVYKVKKFILQRTITTETFKNVNSFEWHSNSKKIIILKKMRGTQIFYF